MTFAWHDLAVQVLRLLAKLKQRCKLVDSHVRLCTCPGFAATRSCYSASLRVHHVQSLSACTKLHLCQQSLLSDAFCCAVQHSWVQFTFLSLHSSMSTLGEANCMSNQSLPTATWQCDMHHTVHMMGAQHTSLCACAQ